MDVSIIIVNYNTKDLIKNCINSIYKNTKDVDFEIIVSDNGSVDGSIEMIKSEFPNVILIENNANLGFGAANNRGLKIAKGKYIFYLNSDTVLLNNAVKYFFDYWEKSPEKDEIGALGSNLLDVNGKVTVSFGIFISPNKIIIDLIKANYGMVKYFLKWIFGKRNFEITKQIPKYEYYIGTVDFVIGADLFMKNDINAYYDENIFLYYEELDLQFQLNKIGKKRLLIEGPKIIHLEGQSSKSNKFLFMEEITKFSSINKNISRIYYCKKNISKFKALIIKILTLTMWLNPLVIKYTYKYIPQLLKR